MGVPMPPLGADPGGSADAPPVRTVLLVDDDALIREIFGETLRLGGYRVLTAANGREALTVLRRGARVDLIITDLFMPEVDGLELLRALRRQRSPTPVIAVSSGGELEQTQLLDLARVLGAARILEKPVDVRLLLEEARMLAPLERPASPPSESGRRRFRILVVDDEPAIVALVTEVLSREGHDVQGASNGRVALDKLAVGRFDMVVTDLRMPELDGIGLYHEIKQRTPDLVPQVVFLTAAALDDTVSAFLRESGALTLEKPFSPDQIRTVIRRAADQGPST